MAEAQATAATASGTDAVMDAHDTVHEQALTTPGGRRLRARSKKVDYNELKDKPEHLYRLVKGKGHIPPPEPSSSTGTAPEAELKPDLGSNPNQHVQIPKALDPLPVWIADDELGKTYKALWFNAVEMMIGSGTPGLFLECVDGTYDPVPEAEPVSAGRLAVELGLPLMDEYTGCIKLGKSLQFPSGQTFEEGTPIQQVLELAWQAEDQPGETNKKRIASSKQANRKRPRITRSNSFNSDHSASTYNPSSSYGSEPSEASLASDVSSGRGAAVLKRGKVRRTANGDADSDVTLTDNDTPASGKSKRTYRKHSGPMQRSMPAMLKENKELPEGGEPVPVSVTAKKLQKTVYGLWTNAEAAIQAKQWAPLVFVECDDDSYTPSEPHTKYKNDRFYMTTGLPSNGGWRSAVRIQQPLTTPDGKTFKPDTNLRKIFDYLTNLKIKEQGIQLPGQSGTGAQEDVLEHQILVVKGANLRKKREDAAVEHIDTGRQEGVDEDSKPVVKRTYIRKKRQEAASAPESKRVRVTSAAPNMDKQFIFNDDVFAAMQSKNKSHTVADRKVDKMSQEVTASRSAVKSHGVKTSPNTAGEHGSAAAAPRGVKRSIASSAANDVTKGHTATKVDSQEIIMLCDDDDVDSGKGKADIPPANKQRPNQQSSIQPSSMKRSSQPASIRKASGKQSSEHIFGLAPIVPVGSKKTVAKETTTAVDLTDACQAEADSALMSKNHDDPRGFGAKRTNSIEEPGEQPVVHNKPAVSIEPELMEEQTTASMAVTDQTHANRDTPPGDNGEPVQAQQSEATVIDDANTEVDAVCVRKAAAFLAARLAAEKQPTTNGSQHDVDDTIEKIAAGQTQGPEGDVRCVNTEVGHKLELPVLPVIELDNEGQLKGLSHEEVLTALRTLLNELGFGKTDTKRLWSRYKAVHMGDVTNTAAQKTWMDQYQKLRTTINTHGCKETISEYLRGLL